MNQTEFYIDGTKYKVVGDLHTHTKYSHGKGTIEANVKAAIDIGLKQIGITDHGPGHLFFGLPRRKLAEVKAEILRLRREYPTIEILFGIEANIINLEGKLDIKPDDLQYFDYICAGWHFGVSDSLTPTGIGRIFRNIALNTEAKATVKQLRQNTKMITSAIKEGGIKFLAHPGDKIPVDILEIAEVCAKAGTLLEINTRHMPMTADIIRNIMQTDVLFIINSDAHTTGRVGDFQAATDLIIEAGLDPDRVVNLKKI